MLCRDIHSNNETVKVAISELLISISMARRDKDKLLCLIVGYGSSGKSHKIKTAVLEKLEELKNEKKCKDFIIGSKLDIFDYDYQRFPGKDKIPEKEMKERNPGKVYIQL